MTSPELELFQPCVCSPVNVCFFFLSAAVSFLSAPPPPTTPPPLMSECLLLISGEEAGRQGGVQGERDGVGAVGERREGELPEM